MAAEVGREIKAEARRARRAASRKAWREDNPERYAAGLKQWLDTMCGAITHQGTPCHWPRVTCPVKHHRLRE